MPQAQNSVLSRGNRQLARYQGHSFQVPDPRSRRWSGVAPGEEAGVIFAARGIDLERFKGKVALADSYSNLQDSSQVGFTTMTTPIAFVRSSADTTDRWWMNAGKLFKTTNTNPKTGWVLDAIATTPPAPAYDLIDFKGALICPTSTDDLSRLSAGVWTANWWTGTLAQPALSQNPHRFFILAGALCITDNNLVHDYDGTIARSSALTLDTGFVGQGGKVLGELAYIFGKQTGGGETYIYTWDRIATQPISRYPVGDTEVLAMFVIDSIYIITKKGLIKRFNGSAFVEFTQFPTVEAQQQITSIHPNGVSVTEHIAKIFVNFGAISNTRLSSGMWNLDIATKNLYNAGSVRNTSTRDYAQYELPDVGALKQTIVGQGLYLAGAQVYTSYPSTSQYGLFTSDEDSTSNHGYLMTTKMHAASAGRYWRKIHATMRNMTSADDRFRIAIRVSDSNVLPAYETVTWTSASTFTATNANIQAGDIVEVIAGENAGAIARITSYTGGTVTIDRSLYASTSLSRIRYLRFIDLGTISNVQVQTEMFVASIRGPFLQALIEFRGSRQSPLLESLLFNVRDLSQKT